MEGTPLQDLSREELIARISQLQGQLATAEQRNQELTKRVEELARVVEELQKRNPTPRLDEAYSMKAEENRRKDAERGGKSGRRKQKSARRGRISTAENLAQATYHEDVFPDGFHRDQCSLKYSRPVWRVIAGRGVFMAYHIYAGPDGRVPTIPGVPKRGEFGQEIIVTLAWQHHIIGLSLDKRRVQQ